LLIVPPPFRHKLYRRFVRNRRSRNGGLDADHRNAEAFNKIEGTNLEVAYAILVQRYDPDVGRLARHPVCMLRSCLLMLLCGITSFTNWVHLMRDEPLYALYSGFEPDDVPGVGTFYDFQDRLLQRDPQPRSVAIRPRRRREQRDKAEQHTDKLDLRPHKGIVNRLADRILDRPCQPMPLAAVLVGHGDFSALPKYQRFLQHLFFTCFVAPSIDRDLIDVETLHTAGDGSKLPTWANPRGKKLCDCDNRGKPPADRCTCHRAYTDPLATWGWDSYRKCWVYGHSVYELTAYDLQHTCQLPLVISMADGSRHDSVHGLATLYHGAETFGLPIQLASLDKAHDALGLYRLAFERWDMDLIIPLNRRNQGNAQYAGPLRLEEGVPICQAGQPMTRWGFCPDRWRIKWRCPLAAAKRTPDLTTCPFFANGCSDSPYGRVIYTYPRANYRLHTRIARDSDLWDLHADARSCAERSVKRKKYDFGLLQTRTAGRDRWFFRVMLAAMCQHIDAWFMHA
jgi:hypothetical protein